MLFKEADHSEKKLIPSVGHLESAEVPLEKSYRYDQNGNIQTLTRKNATGGNMDILAYTYSGNQLSKVDDTGDKTKGFIDGANTGNDYSYDVNGNMVTDQNKSLTAGNAIQYNKADNAEEMP